MVLALVGAGFSLAGAWDPRGFPIAGALTMIASFLTAYRAWVLEHTRQLTPRQRAALIEQLRRALMTCGPRGHVPLTT